MERSYITGGGGGQNLLFTLDFSCSHWLSAGVKPFIAWCFAFALCLYVDMYEDTFVCGYTCIYMCLHMQAWRQPQMFLRHCPCFSFETWFLIGLELACSLNWLYSNSHLGLPQYLDYSCMLPHLAFITFYFIFFLLLFKCGLWEGLCVVGCWLVGFQVLGMDPRVLCVLLRYTSLPFSYR